MSRVPLNVRIPEELKAALKAQSMREYRPVAYLVELALNRYLEDQDLGAMAQKELKHLKKQEAERKPIRRKIPDNV